MKRMKFFLGGLLILGLLTYLVASSFNEKTLVYYKTVGEVRSEVRDLNGKGVRLSGTVVEGSIHRNIQTIDVSFVLAEEGEEIEIRYHGVLPDIFKEGGETVVEGKVHSEGFFEATHVFTKCPSKYEGEAISEN